MEWPANFFPSRNGLIHRWRIRNSRTDFWVTASNVAAPFSFELALNGSSGVYLVPFAEQTTVQLLRFAAPEFQGSWLPTERSVSQEGFDATWKVSYLGRNYPQSWISGASEGQGTMR